VDDKSNPDYYPRIKVNKRWYLIVPELWPGAHSGCAFYEPKYDDAVYEGDKSSCRLCRNADATPPSLDGWDRWDCGDKATIFVPPAKFPEYMAKRVEQLFEDAA
jgi:hypothetical protein